MGRPQPEQGTKRRGPVRQFMAWLGFGPESELAERADHDSPRASRKRAAAARRARRRAERKARRRSEPQTPAVDATPAELAEAIRLAEVSRAEAAARKAMEEVAALERDLDLARERATSRLEELDGRLTEMKRRARGAIRIAAASRRAAEIEAENGRDSNLDGRPKDPLEAFEASVLDAQRTEPSPDASRTAISTGRRRFRRLLSAKSRTG